MRNSATAVQSTGKRAAHLVHSEAVGYELGYCRHLALSHEAPVGNVPFRAF